MGWNGGVQRWHLRAPGSRSFERVDETRRPSREGEWDEPVACEGHHPWQGLTTLSRTERHFPGPPDAAGRLRDPEPVLTIRLAGVCVGTDSSAATWQSVFERSLCCGASLLRPTYRSAAAAGRGRSGAERSADVGGAAALVRAHLLAADDHARVLARWQTPYARPP